jgi:hypothetical protein
MELLTKEIMLKALKCLDDHLSQKVTLIVGGGGAMILAHGFPLATSDIDAVPKEVPFDVLDALVKKVAKKLSLAPDWLNPYYGTFAHTLPVDYGERLKSVFKGKYLEALALGKEEMLIMKCFAGRAKDIAHARALLKKGADVAKVERHIEMLLSKKIMGAQKALDFLDDLLE